MKLLGRGIADAQAFAGRHQAFAQLRIAGQVQIQVQGRLAGFPAPQTKPGEQQARHNAVDQQHAHQPGGPGLASAFDVQRGIATGADHFHGRHAEPEQGRQRTEGLGHGDKGIGAENGGFPDKAIAPGRQQRQQNHQRAEHRQQPQAVDQDADGPAIEFVSLQHQDQGRGQLRGFGVAGELFAEPQPQAPEAGAMFAGKHQAQRPAQQQDQVQSEQTAQGPEHIDRHLAVTQGGKRQTGATDHGQHGQYQ